MTPEKYAQMGLARFGVQWEDIRHGAQHYQDTLNRLEKYYEHWEQSTATEMDQHRSLIASALWAAQATTMMTLWHQDDPQPVPGEYLSLDDAVTYVSDDELLLHAWDVADGNVRGRIDRVVAMMTGETGEQIELTQVPIYKPINTNHAIINGCIKKQWPEVVKASTWMESHRQHGNRLRQQIRAVQNLVYLYGTGGMDHDHNQQQADC